MKKYRGFTLLEMLLVLLIISLLILLFIPNLNKQRTNAQDKSDKAIIQVVETQKEVYQMDKGGTEAVDLNKLVDDDYITDKQLEQYQEAKKNQK